MSVQDKQSWTTFYQMNQKAWDKMTMSHLKSDFYGVDLSSASIEKAIKLSEQLNIKAEFLCANVYEYQNQTEIQ